MERLRSRKLWVAVFAAALVPILKALGFDLNTAEIAAVIGPAVAYVLGQSKVDANAGKTAIPGPLAAK